MKCCKISTNCNTPKAIPELCRRYFYIKKSISHLTECYEKNKQKTPALTMGALGSLALVTHRRPAWPGQCGTTLARRWRQGAPWSSEPSERLLGISPQPLHLCEPILRTRPSSLRGNVAMPTRWLLLIIIYECAVQPSDRQFFPSLAWGPLPNCRRTGLLVLDGTQ